MSDESQYIKLNVTTDPNGYTWNPVVIGAGGGGAGGGANTLTWFNNTSTKENSVSEVFKPRAERELPFKATKLTRDNAKEVAAYILKTLGGRVEVEEIAGTNPPRIAVRIGGFNSFHDGQWIVEEFDYSTNLPTFRQATLGERQARDLR